MRIGGAPYAALAAAVAAAGLAACARGGPIAPDDAAPPPDDAPGCQRQTYYRDEDGDRHGDPARPVEACAPPAGAVADRTDCDDTRADRAPGLPELCDGLDNDCSTATVEQCPAGCTAARRPPPDDRARVYLVCSGALTWTAAQSACTAAQYQLVRIDDAMENAWVRDTANLLLGTVTVHLGATDVASETTWTWDGGEVFWQGGPGGGPVGGRYHRWASGEPNDDGVEDCAQMRLDGMWNDIECNVPQRFLCRR